MMQVSQHECFLGFTSGFQERFLPKPPMLVYCMQKGYDLKAVSPGDIVPNTRTTSEQYDAIYGHVGVVVSRLKGLLVAAGCSPLHDMHWRVEGASS